MSVLWDQYNLIYYLVQWLLFIIIYFFLVIFIPYDLMDWITKALFFLEPIDDKKDESTPPHPPPHCDRCLSIWEWFGKVFNCGCPTDGNLRRDCLEKLSYCCCECVYGSDDLENKKLPHGHQLKLRKEDGQWYCGFMNLNMNRIGIYIILCACIWCASLAFFEGVILSYESVSNGDDCPIPKRGTSATVVDCFIFQNAFDTNPINKTFPTQCNGTVQLSFSGFRAGCFAWIYGDVGVDDVIEELGICAGIIALLGTVVIILYYLCRKHQWRFLFDILACLAVAAIPVLLYRDGNVPFITYILLGTLCGVIIITEYLLQYVPLLTWLCLAIGAWKYIKNCVEPNTQSSVTPLNQNDHHSEA